MRIVFRSTIVGIVTAAVLAGSLVASPSVNAQPQQSTDEPSSRFAFERPLDFTPGSHVAIARDKSVPDVAQTEYDVNAQDYSTTDGTSSAVPGDDRTGFISKDECSAHYLQSLTTNGWLKNRQQHCWHYFIVWYYVDSNQGYHEQLYAAVVHSTTGMEGAYTETSTFRFRNHYWVYDYYTEAGCDDPHPCAPVLYAFYVGMKYTGSATRVYATSATPYQTLDLDGPISFAKTDPVPDTTAQFAQGFTYGTMGSEWTASLTPPSSDSSLRYRCDVTQIAGHTFYQPQGCVFPDILPTLHYKSDVPAIQTHISEARKNGSPAVLNRIWSDDPQYGDNRSRARAACAPLRATWNEDQGDCDEYPFASSLQGGANTNYYFSVKGVNSSDNRRAGSQLGAFYRKDRVMGSYPMRYGTSGDRFKIVIDP